MNAVESLTNKVATIRGHAPVAAGLTAVSDSAVIDMQGYDSVRIIVGFGALTASAVTSVKVQEADAKASATALTNGADLEGSNVAVADSEGSKLVIIDIVKPQKRYLQPVIGRGTANAVVDLVIYELYGARKLPVTQDGTVSHSEIHVSPDEGTA